MTPATSATPMQRLTRHYELLRAAQPSTKELYMVFRGDHDYSVLLSVPWKLVGENADILTALKELYMVAHRGRWQPDDQTGVPEGAAVYLCDADEGAWVFIKLLSEKEEVFTKEMFTGKLWLHPRIFKDEHHNARTRELLNME